MIEKEDHRLYISLIQENINRMANNCASCKTWLVTLVAGLMAVQATISEIRSILWIAIVPIALLYLLDSYYLGIEKRLIKLEQNFVQKLKNKEDCYSDIYNLDPKYIGTDCEYTWDAMKSYSTFPFYGVLLLVVLVLWLSPLFSDLIHINQCLSQ